MSESITSAGYIVMPPEAEQLIEQLKEQAVDMVGSPKDWMAYHHTIEKLNLQAHQSAQRKQDNFVVESLVTYQKFPILVTNLLSVEMWKASVFPLLTCQDDEVASLRLYYILYHEAALANLLEVSFYHEHVVETMDDDMMLEIVDYCMRKLTWLIGLPRNMIATTTSFHKSGQEIVTMMQSHKPRAELQRQQMEIEFRIAVQCVTILRYISERLQVLPLSVVSRLLDKHDVLLSLAILIENPPWTYKDVVKDEKTGETIMVWKKFSQQKWTFVEPSDLLVLTTTEAQVWIAVYYLICSKNAREHYDVTQFRKDQLLRVRKYLNELLVDQLPLLADIQRYLDELSIMQVQSNFAGMKNALVMEAVPYVRDNLSRRFHREYQTIAAGFDNASQAFTRGDDLKLLGELYQMDGIAELLDGSEVRRKEREELRKVATTGDHDNDVEDDQEPEPIVPKRVVLAFHNRDEPRKEIQKKPLIIEVLNDVDAIDGGISGDEELPDRVHVVCDVDVNSQKLFETKSHRYHRYTLRPQFRTTPMIHWNAFAEATIEFGGEAPAIELRCARLELPQVQSRPEMSKREKIWKQIGSLMEDSRVVVQCQLVPYAERRSGGDNQVEHYKQHELGKHTALPYELGSLFLAVLF